MQRQQQGLEMQQTGMGQADLSLSLQPPKSNRQEPSDSAPGFCRQTSSAPLHTPTGSPGDAVAISKVTEKNMASKRSMKDK